MSYVYAIILNLFVIGQNAVNYSKFKDGLSLKTKN